MPRSPDRKKPQPIQTYTQRVENDPSHHLAGPFGPQTPLGHGSAPSSPGAPAKFWKNGDAAVPRWSTKSQGFWSDLKSLRWVIVPTSSLKILLIVVVLWANWEILAPYIAKDTPNPFAPLLFISHRILTSSEDDPRYQKGYLDLVFIAYYIVFWSFVRQVVTIHIFKPIARWFGLKKDVKLDRFGEQGYAVLYWGGMGAWGAYIMAQLPTWWYRTEYFWIDYPHWEMKPVLKRYYLVQAAYWVQQLLVMILGLEKPRKDYNELVAHHFVTIWLIGWSYLVNLTYIGNAVFVSMDIPDSFLGMSKLLNYIQYEKTKITVFTFFIGIWSYFRHWLNFVILWSVLNQFDLMPESAKSWTPEDGVWMVWWMKYQIFAPLLLLQFLNLFWYYFIWRIAYRAVTENKATDERSDDEDDGEDDEPDKED